MRFDFKMRFPFPVIINFNPSIFPSADSLSLADSCYLKVTQHLSLRLKEWDFITSLLHQRRRVAGEHGTVHLE